MLKYNELREGTKFTVVKELAVGDVQLLDYDEPKVLDLLIYSHKQSWFLEAAGMDIAVLKTDDKIHTVIMLNVGRIAKCEAIVNNQEKQNEV